MLCPHKTHPFWQYCCNQQGVVYSKIVLYLLEPRGGYRRSFYSTKFVCMATRFRIAIHIRLFLRQCPFSYSYENCVNVRRFFCGNVSLHNVVLGHFYGRFFIKFSGGPISLKRNSQFYPLEPMGKFWLKK